MRAKDLGPGEENGSYCCLSVVCIYIYVCMSDYPILETQKQKQMETEMKTVTISGFAILTHCLACLQPYDYDN